MISITQTSLNPQQPKKLQFTVMNLYIEPNIISDNKELSHETSKLQQSAIKSQPMTPNTENYDNLPYFANAKEISALTSVGFVSSEFGFYVKG